MQTKQSNRIVLEQETAKFIKSLETPDAKPIYKYPVAEARKLLLDAQANPKDMKAVHIEERAILAGPSGTISLTLVRPENTNEPLPVLMYFHGGGWILGGFKTHEALVRELAVGADALVVFVNYTPSPEAKFPTPIEEAYAATKYIAEHPHEFNTADGKLAVAGDSVGGNMAIAVTLMAKERSGPKIQKQLLFYPVTDANFNNESYQQFAAGPWLTKPAMEWFWDAYAPEEKSRRELTATPLNASIEQLKNLPPALVITAENDVLRDEGEAYARKLAEAGVEVTAMRCLATIHDFVMLNALKDTPAAKLALASAIRSLHATYSK